MLEKFRIQNIHAREILDSRGNPTVEVEVIAASEMTGHLFCGRASVPSGASTGKFEAVELRDGEKCYFGLGVKKAIEHVNMRIDKELKGMDVLSQRTIDSKLLELDGTDNKSNLGANAMLGTSMACARCAADCLGLPLYRYLGGCNAHRMPRPMMNIMNGGKHAANSLDIQEFMIVPVSTSCIKDSVRMGAEVYHYLKHILHKDGYTTAVGDEGGFAPEISSAEEVLSYLKKSVEMAGYKVGEDVAFALDVAASELYDASRKRYVFAGENRERTSEEMICFYEKLLEKYPILSIEDGLAEEDWDGWKEMTKRLGKQCLLVGDDLFVTNPKRIRLGIEMPAANAVLIKVNQIGTLTETLDAIELAHKNGYRTIVSHRSGETEDSFIADLVVATNSGYIKSGAPCRAERTAKYNQLLRIEEMKETLAL